MQFGDVQNTHRNFISVCFFLFFFCRPNFRTAENGLNCLLAIARSGDPEALNQLEDDFYSLIDPVLAHTNLMSVS